MTDHKNNCLICGSELIYADNEEDLNCEICGEAFHSKVYCENKHFICDHCHSAGANEVILKKCLQSKSLNPIQLANEIMHLPQIHMHGPEHHYLAPAVLLTIYYNHLGQQNTKENKLKEALKRSSNVPGGACGYWGTCGAAVGTGIFISLITNANPLSEKSWQLSNKMTAASLSAVAKHPGPRCCKRDTFEALQTASVFLNEHFNFKPESNESITCKFSHLNKECLGKKCPYFKN